MEEVLHMRCRLQMGLKINTSDFEAGNELISAHTCSSICVSAHFKVVAHPSPLIHCVMSSLSLLYQDPDMGSER